MPRLGEQLCTKHSCTTRKFVPEVSGFTSESASPLKFYSSMIYTVRCEVMVIFESEFSC